MSTARITVRIEESLQKRLESAAQNAGKTESEVFREALKDYLDRTEKVVTCYDVFKKAGAIGCYKGGPSDLSTNPKYLEGFGRD